MCNYIIQYDVVVTVYIVQDAYRNGLTVQSSCAIVAGKSNPSELGGGLLTTPVALEILTGKSGGAALPSELGGIPCGGD